MKKLLTTILISLSVSLLFTSCVPAFPEEIDWENEQIKNIEVNELSSVDYTDCTVDHEYLYGFSHHLILGHMSAGTVEKFVQCLKEAEIVTDSFDDHLALEGEIGGPAFRIILNTGEAIYIELDDELANPNYMRVNDVLCKCDDETVSKLRDWEVEDTPGFKNYRDYLWREKHGED